MARLEEWPSSTEFGLQAARRRRQKATLAGGFLCVARLQISVYVLVMAPLTPLG
jgi:hypothetical protein